MARRQQQTSHSTRLACSALLTFEIVRSFLLPLSIEYTVPGDMLIFDTFSE